MSQEDMDLDLDLGFEIEVQEELAPLGSIAPGRYTAKIDGRPTIGVSTRGKYAGKKSVAFRYKIVSDGEFKGRVRTKDVPLVPELSWVISQVFKAALGEEARAVRTNTELVQALEDCSEKLVDLEIGERAGTDRDGNSKMFDDIKRVRSVRI